MGLQVTESEAVEDELPMMASKLRRSARAMKWKGWLEKARLGHGVEFSKCLYRYVSTQREYGVLGSAYLAGEWP